MSNATKIRKHLNALTLQQLRALAVQKKAIPATEVLIASKERLVTALRYVPNVLRPAIAE